MKRRTKSLRDWWVFASGTSAGLWLGVYGAIVLTKGLESVTTALICLLIGLPLGIANAVAWRDAEIERQAIRNEEQVGGDRG